MAAKKPALGRGLSSLIREAVAPAKEEAAGDRLRNLPIEQMQPGKYQPRSHMDSERLAELAESIKAQGLIQPIIVRAIGKDRYEIIAGERRWRAAQLASMREVPVVVRETDDHAALAMALIENIQREDLNPLEEAQGLKRLTDEFGLTHEEAARSVGRSRSAASNLLRLLNLADPVQQLLLAGDLDMGHARALLALEGAEQILVANEVVARKLSVRDAEVLVARRGNARGRQTRLARPQRDKPRDLQRIEQVLSDALAAAVDIRVKKRTRRGEQGEVAIQFGSLDELNGLLQKLGLPAS